MYAIVTAHACTKTLWRAYSGCKQFPRKMLKLFVKIEERIEGYLSSLPASGLEDAVLKILAPPAHTTMSIEIGKSLLNRFLTLAIVYWSSEKRCTL